MSLDCAKSEHFELTMALNRLLKCHARTEITVILMHFQGVFTAHLAETVAKGNGAAL